jgi:hypothetical protein
MADHADKRRRYRLHSLLTGLLLVTLSVLLAWLSVRYPLQSDWTRGGRHTLSAATIAVLGQARGPLTVTAYARKQQDLRQAIRRFVAMYQRVKPDIALRFVDIDAAPEETRRQGIQVNGEMVLAYQGRTEHVAAATEEKFTHAVQRLVRGTNRWARRTTTSANGGGNCTRADSSSVPSTWVRSTPSRPTPRYW